MIITISHQKGGVGKSTILWNLIVEFSKKRKVSVVDLDSQKTITSSLAIRQQVNGGLGNIELIKVEDQKQFITYLENFSEEGLLFIDSGGFDSNMNRLAIAGANVVLTPVSSKFYELLGLQTYEKSLQDMEEKTGFRLVTNVFLNKIAHNAKDFAEVREYIASSRYFNLLDTIVRQRVDFENSPASGKSVVEYNKTGNAAKEFKAFIKELDGLFSEEKFQNAHKEALVA